MLIFPVLDLLAAGIGSAAAIILLDVAKLAPSPGLRRGWLALCGLLCVCVLLAAAHGVLLFNRTAELSDMISTAVFLAGSSYVLAITWLTRRTARELLKMNGLARAAYTDSLTGVGNRRRFMESLESQIAAARASGGALHALALDIDHFKRVNDTHGHAAGDRVLVEVASLIERSIGGGDSVCRMGGEEFSVILPRHDDLSAARLAERLRAGVESLGIDPGSGREITVTISLGLAAWRHGETPADLQRRADEALYAAKRSGRNQMRFAA